MIMSFPAKTLLQDDSDTGLESMSSAEASFPRSGAEPSAALCQLSGAADCPLCAGANGGPCVLHASPEALWRRLEELSE